MEQKNKHRAWVLLIAVVILIMLIITFSKSNVFAQTNFSAPYPTTPTLSPTTRPIIPTTPTTRPIILTPYPTTPPTPTTHTTRPIILTPYPTTPPTPRPTPTRPTPTRPTLPTSPTSPTRRPHSSRESSDTCNNTSVVRDICKTENGDIGGACDDACLDDGGTCVSKCETREVCKQITKEASCKLSLPEKPANQQDSYINCPLELRGGLKCADLKPNICKRGARNEERCISIVSVKIIGQNWKDKLDTQCMKAFKRSGYTKCRVTKACETNQTKDKCVPADDD